MSRDFGKCCQAEIDLDVGKFRENNRKKGQEEHQGNWICQHMIKLNPCHQVEITKDVQDYWKV